MDSFNFIWGLYTLTMLIVSSPRASFINIIIPLILLTWRNILSLYRVIKKRLSSNVYPNLYHVCSISIDFSPTHLVSCRHNMFILLLIIVSIASISFPVKEPIFQVPKQILLYWTYFFTCTSPPKLCLCSVPLTGNTLANPCLLFTVYGVWCSTLLTC